MKNFVILIIVLVAVACVNGFGFGGGSFGGGGGGSGGGYGGAPSPYGYGDPYAYNYAAYQEWQRYHGRKRSAEETTEWRRTATSADVTKAETIDAGDSDQDDEQDDEVIHFYFSPWMRADQESNCWMTGY
uniref:Uncharacterized protein n=1 Tax=Plectus sambesii TaxID=2011161 RepID=A0A914XD08_9BILA